MYMTDAEIRESYEGALKPKAQIQVLADLNACSRDAMLLKLRELGCLSDADVPARLIGPRKGGRPKVEPIDEIRAMDLYNEGMDDIAISEALGVPVTRVVSWRSRMHLTRWRQKKQKEHETMARYPERAVEDAVIEAEEKPAAPAPAEPKKKRAKAAPAEKAMQTAIHADPGAGPMNVEQLAALFAGAAKVFPEAQVQIEGGGPLVVGASLDIRYDAEHGGLDAAGMVLRLITGGAA